MDKEKTIQIIKARIISERRKHKDLDWEEIAARKIYASVVKLFAIPDVSNSEANVCLAPNILHMKCEIYEDFECEQCKWFSKGK